MYRSTFGSWASKPNSASSNKENPLAISYIVNLFGSSITSSSCLSSSFLWASNSIRSSLVSSTFASLKVRNLKVRIRGLTVTVNIYGRYIAPCLLSFQSSQQPCEVGISIPIIQMRELSLGEIKEMYLGNKDFNIDSFTPAHKPEITVLC